MNDTPRTDACYRLRSTDQGEVFDRLDILARTLERELDAMTAERDTLQIQHGTCTVCGYVAWKERGRQQDCQYCAMTAERNHWMTERDKLREALEGLQDQGSNGLRSFTNPAEATAYRVGWSHAIQAALEKNQS